MLDATEDNRSADVRSEGDADAGRGDAKPGTGRGRILKFVIIFVVLVMAFLTSYRYAMNTEANMRYLFMVASHTTAVLSLVGDEAELEPFREGGAKAKRAELETWRRENRAIQLVPPIEPGSEPLTPLESWLYKAYSKVRNAGSIQDDGPTIRLVAEEGIDAKRARLQRELRGIGPGEAARADAINDELTALAKREEAIPAGPERVNAKRGKQFSFRVVPDCGAIPSMSIYLAAVLAFPTRIWKRLAGAIGGLFALYWINVLRLATLAYIGAVDQASGGQWFSFVHEYLWQGVFIIFVVAVWMAWIELVVRPRRS